MSTETPQQKRSGGSPAEWKIVPLAPGAEIFRSPDPAGISVGSPSVLCLPGGKILASLDLSGPGVKHLPGGKGRSPTSGHWLLGKLYMSSDKGKTWAGKLEYPFSQAQLLRVSGSLYLIGLASDLRIMRSADGGETWSKPVDLKLPEADHYLSPVNVLFWKERVHIVLTRRIPADNKDPDVPSCFVPVILSARDGADLTDRKVWSISDPGKPLHQLMPRNSTDFAGVSLFPQAARGRPGQRALWVDWEAPHMVAIKDARHSWNDPGGRRCYMLGAAGNHRGNMGILATIDENEAGKLVFAEGSSVPPLIPMPGGNHKFDVVFDEESRLWWMISNPAMDALQRRSPASAANPQNPPPDARSRLELFYSADLFDWHFAGLVDVGTEAQDLRHLPGLAIGGSSLHVVCCAGRSRPGTHGYTERVTFHTIPLFRELAQ